MYHFFLRQIRSDSFQQLGNLERRLCRLWSSRLLLCLWLVLRLLRDDLDPVELRLKGVYDFLNTAGLLLQHQLVFATVALRGTFLPTS